MEALATAEERAFREHLQRPDFQLGTIKQQWRLLRVAWPTADFALRARDGTEWGFRFLLDGYPAQLPNARPCDIETGAPLAAGYWPKGAGRVAAAFNPNWNAAALYLPCDRMALPGHEQWIVEHPELLWKPTRGIVHYLEIIHDLLASFAYFAPVRPAA
ncbi:hypothetical protein RFN29_21680 [Mesorhizobium sp. VK22B]|uniref:Uncharacterized protein n=1 Tax=Mesorhizobium captivum TaxID=3072319 RepID=A0ABU4Z5I7_9HYPH|nr:hypothetical protein [Mesorhizobium sp. VK22B]MDX8494181.1 hypothetical protein [Mesorhizobium sp. VK22B]